MKGSVDMTHGPIAGKTMKFALFLAATGMMQQLFNAIDAVIMGQFVGKEAMAAVGSSVPLVAFIITFFIGISLGANVVIARLTGAGNGKRLPPPSTRPFSLPCWRACPCWWLGKSWPSPYWVFLWCRKNSCPFLSCICVLFSGLAGGAAVQFRIRHIPKPGRYPDAYGMPWYFRHPEGHR